jgi:thiol-disulfide isomerase/thioredoxin
LEVAYASGATVDKIRTVKFPEGTKQRCKPILELVAMRRSLVPILIIVGAFVVLPLALRELFPVKLPVVDLVARSSPRELTDFTFSDGSGRNLTLDRFRDNFVLVNVWATWCTPCKDEMASLNHLALLLANKNIKIVPISIDVSGLIAVRSFFERLRLNNLSIYVDPSKNVMDALGITGIPTSILIDRNGREIGRMVGPAQWDAPESVKRIIETPGL